MATEGLPPDRVPQETRRQTLSQLEEAIRNYPGAPSTSLHNAAEVEKKLFEQSRTADEYTSRLQKVLFIINTHTKRKSLQNLAAQNPQQQPPSGPPSLSQPSSLQQQQQQLSGGISYSVSGTNMAGMNPAAGMGMTRPMQQGGAGYQGYQAPGAPMHPSQHTHYAPHMHRGMASMQPGGMQAGMHTAQRPMMTGGNPGMMHGGHQGFGHAHNPMGVPSYPQNYPPHYNSTPSQMQHPVGMGQRHPAINPSLIRQQPRVGGMAGGGGMMGPGINMVGAGRGGMVGAGGGVMGRVGGYGGPMMQVQSGYPPNMSSSVQSVQAIPNPSYLPTSSTGGVRQPAPPYDAGGMQPPTSSVAAPSLPAASTSAPPASSSSSYSQPQSSLPHPPSTTVSATSNPTTSTTSSLMQQPVPSPAPPTLLLPASSATSVGSPTHSTVTPEENEAYLRTHHELQMYVPLLNRMMNRMTKEGEEVQRSEQYMKLKSLLSLLQDKKKRVPLPTFMKCKTALEKMFEQQQLREHLKSASSSTMPTPVPLPPPSSITNDTYREFLRGATKKGYVYVTLVKVIIEGPAGVGKTCLMYLLLGKSPPSSGKRHSTGCAERAIRVIRVGKEGEKWYEISTNEFQEMIAEAVPILYEELKAKGQEVDDLSGLGSGEVEGEDKVGGGKTTSVEDSKLVVDEINQKLTELVGSCRSSHRLLDMELIYITDSGGQQPFWDLKPIFMRDTSATIFVNRLCEKLDEQPLNDLYQSGKQVGPSQRATLTTAEAFKTMLRGRHEGGEYSKIITVGTHKDLAHECDETPEEKNEKFAAIASPHFIDDLVHCNEGLQEILFQVNTIDPKDDDKKEASKIRASIEKCATQHKIPIWWFILQLILEALAIKLGREVLSKDECVHVSSSLGFSEGELDAALEFFDKLNIFLYKKHILPRIVFTNPQVPLDKLSKLVEKQYHLKAAEADPTKAANKAMTGDWQKFRDRAVLTLKFLKEEEFNAHYTEGIFTATDFLVLLKKLLVVAPLSDKESSAAEYFFPAILGMTEEVKINACLASCRDTKIAALVVWFPTGWAPPGVYCCSVCYLQSHAHWEVVDKAPKPCITPDSEGTHHSQLQHISRNCITFTKRSRPGSVTFIDNFSFFVVCVNVDTSDMQQDELTEHCQAIRSEVFAAVETGLQNTHHTKSHPKYAFLCPRQNESCSTELHTAHVSDNGKRWICSKNNDVFSNISPPQTVWLHEIAATAGRVSVPTAADFANYVVAEIPAEWTHVAVQLGLSGDKCNAIKIDKHDCRGRFMAVFYEWERGSYKPFTWSTLITALKSPVVGKIELAEKLQQKFCSLY